MRRPRDNQSLWQPFAASARWLAAGLSVVTASLRLSTRQQFAFAPLLRVVVDVFPSPSFPGPSAGVVNPGLPHHCVVPAIPVDSVRTPAVWTVRRLGVVTANANNSSQTASPAIRERDSPRLSPASRLTASRRDGCPLSCDDRTNKTSGCVRYACGHMVSPTVARENRS